MFLLSPSIVSAVIIRFIVIRLIVIWRIILRFGIEEELESDEEED